MGNYQAGYGHGDVVGVPFDFYAGATGVVTGATYTMQTNQLVLFPAASVTGVTVNLPLNPADGCCAEISNVGLAASTVTLTVAPNTGDVIVETFKKLKFDPLQHPAVLVASHGPFTWGKDVADAVHNAGMLEFIARLNSETLNINPKLKPMQSHLLDKHFLRKHGPGAYYGQK